MKWVTSSSSTQGATMAASSGVSGRRATRSPERKMPASVRSVTARSSWRPEDRLHRRPLQALVHVPASDRLRRQRQHLVVHLTGGLHRHVVVRERDVMRAGEEEAQLDAPLLKEALEAPPRLAVILRKGHNSAGPEPHAPNGTRHTRGGGRPIDVLANPLALTPELGDHRAPLELAQRRQARDERRDLAGGGEGEEHLL